MLIIFGLDLVCPHCFTENKEIRQQDFPVIETSYTIVK